MVRLYTSRKRINKALIALQEAIIATTGYKTATNNYKLGSEKVIELLVYDGNKHIQNSRVTLIKGRRQNKIIHHITNPDVRETIMQGIQPLINATNAEIITPTYNR